MPLKLRKLQLRVKYYINNFLHVFADGARGHKICPLWSRPKNAGTILKTVQGGPLYLPVNE